MSALLLEDGSYLLLEDGASHLLLDDGGGVIPSSGAGGDLIVFTTIMSFLLMIFGGYNAPS